MRFDQHIQESLNRLPPAEQRVGTWLLEHFSSCLNMPLAEVAREAGVSEPTVIRFCRSLGLGGFRELRTEIIAARQSPDSYVHQDVLASDSTTRAVEKVLDSSIRSMVELRADISRMPFDGAAAAIASARQIVFMGMGASAMVAEDARHKFFRLGIPCTTAVDPQTILQQASVAASNDVLVGISHTGEWPDLIRAISGATAAGATCIAVTTPASPLATAATFTFGCAVREDTSVFTPMTSRLIQLAILDAMQIAAALRMGENAEVNLRRSKEALTAYRGRWNRE